MNLLEVFDRPDGQRSYYRAKRPIAVLLSIFCLVCMAISTPAGAFYLESLLSNFLPFGATAFAWAIAIGFDGLLAIIAANFFADIFRGLDQRQSYWDIPTIVLLSTFLTASVLASVFGADVRKARASKELAKVEAAAIDSTLMAVTSLATADKLKQAPKGADKSTLRQVRKHNETINEAKALNAEKIGKIKELSDQKAKVSQKAEEQHHALIDSSKTVIVVAYILLMVFIGCIEYIKSKKPKESATGSASHQNLAGLKKGTIKVNTDDYLSNKNRVEVKAFKSQAQKDEELAQRAAELRAKGLSLRKVGAIIGVSAPTVSKLVKSVKCKV